VRARGRWLLVGVGCGLCPFPGAKGTGVYPIHEPSIESYNPASISTPDQRQECRRVVSLMLAKSEDEREAFRTPLDRLSLSGRRGRTVDRHLDVGIALEAVLAFGDQTKTDIGYRLRVRAARFLGGTLDERRGIAERVKKLYQRRSTIGHGEDLAKAKSLEEAERRWQELTRDRVLVARVIMRALEKGIPDWETFDLEG